jgi:hypothetical protein
VRSRISASIILLVMCVAVLPCVATPITTDGSWYNFFIVKPPGATDGNVFATAGSSCQAGPPDCTEPYFNAGAPPWTFTIPTGMQGLLMVVDGGHQGDVYAVYNSGVQIGSTNPVAVDTSHNCGGFPTPCENDPVMSKGSFALGAGSYSITIRETNYFEDSFLAWFNVTTSGVTSPPSGPPGGAATPEPATCALVGSALLAVGLLRRRRA